MSELFKGLPIIALDYETYFDDDYSLKKIPNFEYVSDPRFHAHGISVVDLQSDEAYWVDHDNLPAWFEEHDYLRNHAVLTQNAYFDCLISAYHYGCWNPGYLIDTKGMANALVKPFTKSSSLQDVAKFLGFEGKHEGGEILGKVKGMREIPPDLYEELVTYAIQDSRETVNVFLYMLNEDPVFPAREFDVMDLHIRLYLRRIMRIDYAKLNAVRNAELSRRQELAAKLRETWPEVFGELTDSEIWSLLRKDDVLAKLITGCGALPPRKRSPTTGKLVYAFAKSDLGFQALRASGPKLELLVEGRATAGANLILNRLDRLELMHNRFDGWAHPLLNYHGAHTGRSSGGDKLNFQNLPKNPEEFRHIFVPPEGHKVLVCDSGQIEARVVAYLAGQLDLIDAFREADELVRQGKDPKALGKDVYTVMAHKIGSDSRALGKAVVLGCGFGMSESKFVLHARASGNDASEEQLREAWRGWRTANPRIVEFWFNYEEAFKMAGIGQRSVEISGLHLEPYRGGVIVWLPSGRPLVYGNVRMVMGTLACSRGKLWYGSLVENVVQAYARDVVFYQTLEQPKLCERLWLLIHDEIDLVVPEDQTDEYAQLAFEALSARLDWCRDLPTIGEPTIADHFLKA